jgi:multiple sugar transport system substrate-binding protein
MRDIYKNGMSDEVFAWTAASNNQAFVAGRLSLAVNAISIARTLEASGNTAVSDDTWLASIPRGPVLRMGNEHVMGVYAIWKFAQNQKIAKKFLIDYTTDFRQGFVAGEFYDFPCFEKTVPDLKKLIANDPKGHPADQYKVLEDVLNWATNVG